MSAIEAGREQVQVPQAKVNRHVEFTAHSFDSIGISWTGQVSDRDLAVEVNRRDEEQNRSLHHSSFA